MKRLRLGAATLNQTPLDWDGNTQRILQSIEQARQQNVHVLCLPELCMTGYANLCGNEAGRAIYDSVRSLPRAAASWPRGLAFVLQIPISRRQILTLI